MFVGFCIAMISFCIICCQKCKDIEKEAEEERKDQEINKSLQKRENDWWVESGGPPVTNEGQVADILQGDA